MTKQEFFKQVAAEYYDELKISLDDFCKLYSKVSPIFGDLEVERAETDDEIVLKFIDVDIADVLVGPLDPSELSEEDLDMSTVSLIMILDKKGKIKFVEHGVGILTPANKDIILFLGSLIGKQIIL